MMTRYDSNDIRQRALVESNILKSVILEANRRGNGEFKPSLEDLILHDYQISSSATLNAILSNYMVDISYLVDCYLNPTYVGQVDSYFQVVRNLEGDTLLPNATRLVLDLDDDGGTFKSRDLVLDIQKIDLPEGVDRFVNLSSTWYGITGGESEVNQIVLPAKMNNFYISSSRFGNTNPFDFPLLLGDGGDITSGPTFNEWLKDGKNNYTIKRIVDNGFLGNLAFRYGSGFGNGLSKCDFLACLSGWAYDEYGHKIPHSGFYGLEGRWNGSTKEFLGFVLHPLHDTIPNLEASDMEFQWCGFTSANDQQTLMLVANQWDGSKCKFFYLSEDTFDETYGLTLIDQLVDDELIVNPSKVFNKVDSIRELNDISVAMTDYGFWDIEVN